MSSNVSDPGIVSHERKEILMEGTDLTDIYVKQGREETKTVITFIKQMSKI